MRKIFVAVLLAVTFPLTAFAFNGHVKPAQYRLGVRSTDGVATVVVNRVSNIGGNDTTSVSYRTINTSTSPVKPGVGFGPTSGTLTFGPGETSKSFHVNLIDDNYYTRPSSPKSFWVALSNPTNNYALRASDGGEAGPPFIVTVEIFVTEGNPPPAISWSQPSYDMNEADGGVAVAMLRGGATGNPVHVGWAAYNEQRHSTVTGFVDFAPGETSKSFTIPIPNDHIVTGNRDWLIVIFVDSAQGVVSKPFESLVYITEDDQPNTPPKWSISDATANENNGSITFHLSITRARPQPASITYTTSNGTAIAGADYTATSDTVTLPASPGGEGAVIGISVSVPLRNNGVSEPAETFTVTLSNPVNATILDGSGTGTIVDDDQHPSVYSISDTLVGEGDEGLQTMTFVVTREGTDAAGSVRVTTRGQTADATDYTGDRSLVLSFAPGETSKNVTVMVAGDRFHEGDDLVTADLSDPQGGGITRGHAAGTIANDDPAPRMRVSDGVLTGNQMVFTVTLSEPSGLPAIARFATRDGSAQAGVDYGAASGLIVVDAGMLSKTISVPVLKLPVAARMFRLELTAPSNTTLEQPVGVATLAPAGRRRASGR